MSPEQLAMLVAALNALGKLLQNNPLVPDVWIPHILAAVGVVVGMALAGFTVPIGIEGLIAGAGAVGVHQMFTQLRNGKDEKAPTVNVSGGGPTGTATAG